MSLLLAAGAAASPPQPQRLYLWRSLALVALGLAAAEEEGGGARAASLHSYRSSQVAISGAPWYLWPRAAPREETQTEERRGDHAALHRYRQAFQTVGQSYRQWPPPAKSDQTLEPDAQRTSQTLLHIYRTGFQTVGQSYRIQIQSPPLRIDPEEDIQRGQSHSALHRFRVGYQTVGQSYRILRPTPAVADQSLPEDAQRGSDHSLLHRYRTGFQTVGQPFQLWPGAQKRLEAEQYTPPKPVDLSPYRQSTSVATARWYLWPPKITRIELEDDSRRADHSLLHRYRVGYQTVGQGYRQWPAPAKADQTVEPDAQRLPQLLHLYRPGYQTVGQQQQVLRWKTPIPGESEEHVVSAAKPDLHLYRTGFQTVGQPWQSWPKAQLRVDDEAYAVPIVRTLRQVVTSAVTAPGQPWWAWRPPVADQTVEPNPVVIDHAAALTPFRPHQAAQPVEPPAAVGPGNGGYKRLPEPRKFVLYPTPRKVDVQDPIHAQKTPIAHALEQIRPAIEPTTRNALQNLHKAVLGPVFKAEVAPATVAEAVRSELPALLAKLEALLELQLGITEQEMRELQAVADAAAQAQRDEDDIIALFLLDD